MPFLQIYGIKMIRAIYLFIFILAASAFHKSLSVCQRLQSGLRVYEDICEDEAPVEQHIKSGHRSAFQSGLQAHRCWTLLDLPGKESGSRTWRRHRQHAAKSCLQHPRRPPQAGLVLRQSQETNTDWVHRSERESGDIKTARRAFSPR